MSYLGSCDAGLLLAADERPGDYFSAGSSLYIYLHEEDESASGTLQKTPDHDPGRRKAVQESAGVLGTDRQGIRQRILYYVRTDIGHGPDQLSAAGAVAGENRKCGDRHSGDTDIFKKS